MGNVDELIEVHSSMNTDIEDACRGHPREQKLGKIFLRHGLAIREAHQTYWANHPKAVGVLDRCRDRLDKFMEGTNSRFFL